MISICMTNGGVYSNVNSINEQDVSDINPKTIAKILDNYEFIHIVLFVLCNGGQEAILRTSCISSVNYF